MEPAVSTNVALTEVRALNFYQVFPNQPVMLRMKVGFGQPGGTAILHRGAERTLDSGQLETVGVSIGEGEDLTSSVLHCTTNVRDVSDDTNKTAVTYILDGGPDGEVRFPYQLDAPQHGDTVPYFVSFMFI